MICAALTMRSVFHGSGGEGGDLLGEGEVFSGDAAGVVGGEAEGDFVIADVDVGVVVGGFGEEGNLVNEVDGGEEVYELEGAGELVVDEAPDGERLQAMMDLIAGKGGHGGGSFLGKSERDI